MTFGSFLSAALCDFHYFFVQVIDLRLHVFAVCCERFRFGIYT
jgi:hypothetical protein